MLKVKDTFIKLKNVLYIEKAIQEPNSYNDFTKEFIIDFVFGENYSYQVSPYKDGLGYQRIHESEKREKIHKRFCFTNENEFNEIISELEKVEDK